MWERPSAGMQGYQGGRTPQAADYRGGTLGGPREAMRQIDPASMPRPILPDYDNLQARACAAHLYYSSAEGVFILR